MEEEPVKRMMKNVPVPRPVVLALKHIEEKIPTAWYIADYDYVIEPIEPGKFRVHLTVYLRLRKRFKERMTKASKEMYVKNFFAPFIVGSVIPEVEDMLKLYYGDAKVKVLIELHSGKWVVATRKGWEVR